MANGISGPEMASCLVKLPQNLQIILSHADSDEEIANLYNKLIHQLHTGLFLKQKKQKFWIDIITSANAFEFYARDLSISWGDDKSHWRWTFMEDINGAEVETAELLEVWWLDVKKNFPTEMLTTLTSYEVSIVLKKTEGNSGFENSPVNLKLILSNKVTVERQEDLSAMPTNEWKEIRVGGFVTPSDNRSGDLEISMYEHKYEKKGLVVNKIIVRPVTKDWKEISGESKWDGLLDPLNVELVKCITGYGERLDTIYDSIIEDENSPRYGFPMYEEKDLFSKVGPDKCKAINCHIYEVRKYIYAWVDVSFVAEWIYPDRSTWIGYVAVATDQGKKVLGRRDILVCWRGTSSDSEWEKNTSFLQTDAKVIFPSAEDPEVHNGFYSIYTQSNYAANNKSARDQVIDEVINLVNQHQKEEVSITVTGHSLGAALATMNAADIVSNGYNKPSPNLDNKEFLVTAFVFASPKVGDTEFKNEFNKLIDTRKLRFLRITNTDDFITKVPPITYDEVGYHEITFTTTNASEDEGGKKSKKSKAHSLKNYIRELYALPSLRHNG